MPLKPLNVLHNASFNSSGKLIICCSTDNFNILEVETGNKMKNIEFPLEGIRGEAKFS